MMEIILRATSEADLPAIFHIRQDRLVQPHQYKLTPRDTADAWKQMLFRTPMSNGVLFQCTTILQENKIIGYINQLYSTIYAQRICRCGWDLAPAYWGQGIAAIALSQVIDSLFHEEGIDMVIADCFANNHRCTRVLQKLNFEPAGMFPGERIQIMYSKRCFHWINRFQLTARRWRERPLAD